MPLSAPPHRPKCSRTTPQVALEQTISVEPTGGTTMVISDTMWNGFLVVSAILMVTGLAVISAGVWSISETV